jgi:gliding motility-associated-like protein
MRNFSPLTLIWGLTFTVLFSLPQVSLGSHAMGGDLTYIHLGANQYRVIGAFYRDCFGISAPGSLSLQITNICGYSANATLTPDFFFNGLDTLFSGMEVSPLCPDDIDNSTCNGGSLPGSEVYIYTADISIPDSTCPEYTFSFSVNARNAAIDNLIDPDGNSIYVEAKLNPTVSINNNSPLFTQIPITFVCAGQPFNFNHGAVDLDGDSLVYSLIQPRDDAFLFIPYVDPPYSIDYPITTVSGVFPFDTETGQMTFTPDIEQTCVVAVLVEEYRDGEWIGSTMRDIQIIVGPCSNIPPAQTSTLYNTAGGAPLDSNSVEACPGDSIRFDVDFAASDSSLLLDMSTNLSLVIPGATVTFSGSNPVTASFFWPSTVLDTGFYVFNIFAADDACPISATSAFSFDITILGGTRAFPPYAEYCPGGDPIALEALGGGAFEWTPPTGLDDPFSATPLASPDVTTVYVVESDLSGNCNNLDTVTIFVDTSAKVEIAPVDPFICQYESVALNAAPSGIAPDSTGWEFSWSPVGDLNDPTLQEPTASPGSTIMYFVETVTNGGCVLRDSVTVFVDDQLSSAGNDTTLCPGLPAFLNASGGVSYEWFPADGLDCSDCPDPTATIFSPEVFTVAITKPNNCIDTHQVIVNTYPIPVVDAGPDTSLFLGESVTFDPTGGFVVYDWQPDFSITATNIENPTVNPPLTTLYIVTVVDNNGCITADSILVTINNYDEVFIPTAFSPNGDGANDILQIIDRGVADLEYFEIYNRWGELVFRTTDINQGWDGKYEGKDQDVGTYVYTLKARLTKEADQLQNGTITLVR